MEQARLLGMSAERELRLTARNAELVKALEEAQRDAERYRWLREWRHRWEVRYWTGTWWDSLTVGGLDMAIDAALKGDAT